MHIKSLAPPVEEFVLDIVPGSVQFHVKPMTLQTLQIAQAEARAYVSGVEESYEQCQNLGFVREGLPDLSQDFVRDGLYRESFILALGRAHITAWSGVEDDHGPAPVSDEAIAAVLQNPILGLRFHDALMEWYLEYLTAKKDSGTVLPGTSSPDAVPNTAPAASAMEQDAPAA